MKYVIIIKIYRLHMLITNFILVVDFKIYSRAGFHNEVLILDRTERTRHVVRQFSVQT